MSNFNNPTKTPKLHLDKRLKTVAEMVRLDKKIADIGTDHAFVPCYLSRQGAKGVIASDISDGPLACAKATIELYEITDITLIKSDGLDNIPPVDDVIIAGMGGETIADIISRCTFLNENMHFILQPMTREHLLRRELYRMGLEIITEKTAAAAKKVYTVMLCRYTGEKKEIDEVFAFLGKNTGALYRKKVLDKLEKMGKGEPAYNKIYQKIKNEAASAAESERIEQSEIV